MGSVERAYDRGTRRATHALRELGEDLRHARLEQGASQRTVAAAARIDRGDYSRIEAGTVLNLSIARAYRIGAVLGLRRRPTGSTQFSDLDPPNPSQWRK